MDDDDWRPLTSTWYHEAGHAVAAAICGGHVNSMNFGGGEPEVDVDVEHPSDRVFMIWAGPSAQVYQEDANEYSIDRVSGLLHTQSFSDWQSYEEAMDPDRAAQIDVQSLAANLEFASYFPDHPTKKKPENLPSVASPDPSWGEKLAAAWSEIRCLAEDLINGESLVTLSNGQKLVRYGDFSYWYDPERVKDPRPRSFAQ